MLCLVLQLHSFLVQKLLVKDFDFELHSQLTIDMSVKLGMFVLQFTILMILSMMKLCRQDDDLQYCFSV